MRRKAVATRVATTALWHAGPTESLLDHLLQQRFRYMVSACNARARIERAFRGREDLLPQPGRPCVGLFACPRLWQIHVTIPIQQIRRMEQLDLCKVLLEPLLESPWEHGDTVLPTFAVTYSDVVIGKISVLHPQA